jgi:hypothetical protein
MKKPKRVIVWLVADGSALVQLEFYDKRENITKDVFFNAFQAYKYAKRLSEKENIPIAVDIIP